MDNAIYGSAKAWVNFTGSSGSINGSYNVSSITRNNTGYYTINMTNAMPNTNYAVNVTVSTNGSVAPYSFLYCDTVASNTLISPTTSSFVFCVSNSGQSVRYDPSYCMVSVFR